MRQLEIIGEDVTNLPSELIDQEPDIPWSRIVGMRTLLAHGYFKVDPDVVWDTVANSLGPLHEAVERLLEQSE